MYGLVLMMALGGSAETPEFGRKGCNGCDGGGCHGGGLFGGHGCHGGGLFGGHGCNGGGLFSGHGCNGGGHGCNGGGHGCNGGGHACNGGGLFSRLRNRHGCHGNGHGCDGCHSNGHGCHVSHGCSGHAISDHGCSGGHVIGCAGGHIIGGIDGGHMRMEDGKKGGEPEKLKEMPKEKKDKTGVSLPAPATIVVELPADAQLTIDEAATRATSAVRTFVTPNLTPAKAFSYTLKAKVVRDGQTLTVAQTVAVKAGEETRVTFDAGRFLTTVVAAR